MKTLKKLLFSVTLVLAQTVLAHGDHKTMSLSEAIANARVYADQLIAEKKLGDSWKEASVSPLETKEKAIGGKKRWSVVLKNEKEKDSSKTKLEILMTPAGRVLEHNFKTDSK